MISVKKVIASFKDKTAYDFSSVQCDLPQEIADKIYQWGLENIPDEDLDVEAGGRQQDIHVTIKYGLHTIDFTKVRDFLINQKPISVELGDITIFNTDEADVIKIDVYSPAIHELNKIISNNFDVTNTHPEYIPHVTVGYVKKGLGQKYDGRGDFRNLKFVLYSALFSGRDNRRILMKFPNP